ncbi:AbrB/MazE/SpoVT family DNA-binding domain-containing protein [Vandammella animalimorsus]|uniref:AbrB/MazE/SpoVT family DNA-binding domain-containing protein n=1 Tax=Vandammella animalimorsus TaxID=2029117 RepID=UPI0031BB6B84
MLVKLTTKNQITLPKAVVSAVDAAEYFNVQVENGRIVLMPARIHQAQAVLVAMSLGGNERIHYNKFRY